MGDCFDWSEGTLKAEAAEAAVQDLRAHGVDEHIIADVQVMRRLRANGVAEDVIETILEAASVADIPMEAAVILWEYFEINRGPDSDSVLDASEVEA